MDIAREREELRAKVAVVVRERHLCGSFGYEQAPKSNKGEKKNCLGVFFAHLICFTEVDEPDLALMI